MLYINTLERERDQYKKEKEDREATIARLQDEILDLQKRMANLPSAAEIPVHALS